MRQFFNPENAFWNFVGKLADATMLSILWLVTSLPIVTLGASTAAFYDFTMKAVRDQEDMLFHGYFAALKRHWKKGTILGFFAALGILFFTVDFAAAVRFGQSAQGKCGGLALLVFLLVMAVLFLSIVMYAMGLLVTFGHPVKKILHDAPAFAFQNLPATLILMGIIAGSFVLFYFLSGFFFFWVGAAIFLSSYLLNAVFQRRAV